MCLDNTYVCVDTMCLLHRYPATGTRSYRLKLVIIGVVLFSIIVDTFVGSMA